MKSHYLFFLLLTAYNFCTAQLIDFEIANPQPNLIDVYGGSFASGDIDADGDIDLLISGLDPGRETALYLNDGNGAFTEVTNIPFPEASSTASFFEDLDGDGDLDLYFSGIGFSVGEFTHIYLNDGNGVFTQQANALLPEFQGKGAAIEDVDNDGDLDLLISAKDVNDVFLADVFLNDGNANFTPANSPAFTPVKFAAVAFIDVENDGDPDVIIAGKQANDDPLTSLYINDGSGNYSIDATVNLEQLAADDIDVADIDNDGDMDILMSGMSASSGVKTLLYLNDGNGVFTELTTANLQQTFAGTNAIADLDNDGDNDIVIIGSQAGGLPNIFNIVYENLGNNEFIPAITLGGEYIAACVIDDFNGDNRADIIIQGFVDDTNVYWNNSEVLGVSDQTIGALALQAYPNPISDIVTINASETIDMIHVYNILGQEIVTQESNSNQLQLDMSNQAAGQYILQVRSEGTFENIKLVKQ